LKRMQNKMKTYTTALMTSLMLAIIIAAIPMASAAGAITLTPSTQAPGGTVSVGGTGFGVTKKVGIGFGAEVTVSAEVHPITNLVTTPDSDGAYGPFGGTTNHYPIKPGSVYIFYDVDGVTSDYTDNGDGTLTSSSAYAVNPYVNYVNGSFGRKSNTDWSGFTAPVAYINYTYYTYNVTPAAGATTTGAGAFTASITVPSVANGAYTVTAVDTAGNKATSTLTVDSTIPEGWTVGAMMLVSAVTVIVGSRYFRKQPKVKQYSLVKV
jgi:hypothetical protein